MLEDQSLSELLDDSLPTNTLENHNLLYNSNHTQTQTQTRSPTPSVSPPYHSLDFHLSPSTSALNLPGTPSYAGSYQDSPASIWADIDEGLNLYQGQSDNHDHSDYDIPDKAISMYSNDNSPFDLINENFEFAPSDSNPTVSVVPAEPMSLNHDTQLAVNHPSPASSSGYHNDYRSPSPMRSRASSIGSSHDSPHNSSRVTDPQWGVTAPSPPANAPSPHNGSRSPPALMIPDASNTSSNHLNPGVSFGIGVNENADNRGLAPDGPGINLIPATPISIGGNGASTAPFAHNNFQRAGTPQRQSSRVPSPTPSIASNAGVDANTMWPSQHMEGNPNMRVPSPAQASAMQPQFLNSGSSGLVDGNMFNGGIPSNPASPYTAPSPSVSPHPSPILGMLDLGFGGGDTATHGSLSVPAYKHQRSKSETYSQAQRPSWALGVNTYSSTANLPSPFGNYHPGNNIQPSNMQQLSNPMPFMLPPPTSADPLNPNFPRLDPPQMNHVASFVPGVNPNYNVGEMFLNPDLNAARRFGHRRSVKSEDLSPYASTNSLTAGFTIDQSGLLAPPNHPSLMVPAEQYGRGRTHGFMDHHRRASSGSRSSISAASSARASPYPSPNASPMVNYAELHPDTATMAKVNMESLNLREKTTPPPTLTVARPHVTTSATQAASATRRTSEATFTCPVPGCGSTFTRHFNLKGHLRSHNDERPFRCKWPGCEKGFARQHDCKRHEQLHLNIRPYTCEGCSRTFARMDALNRHLRSEGGAECAKHQQPLTEDRSAKTDSAVLT